MSRRPLDHLPRISCDDACHKARGSLGGTDYAVVVGTPVFAMFAGIARYRVAGTGGWTITIEAPNGQVGELMHLSRSNDFVLGGPSRPVLEGELVAWSGGAKGAPGSGSATGPHLHAHVIVAGVRYGMEEYLADPQFAGAGTPIEEEEMSDIVNLVDESTYKDGKAVAGTICASLLPSGRVMIYPRDPADENEIARLMTTKAGPHIVCTHEEFVAWTTEPAAGPVGSVQVAPMTLTGTITPA